MTTKKKPAQELDTGERKPFETLEGLKDEIKEISDGTADPGTKKSKRGPYNKTKKSKEPDPPAVNAPDSQAIEAGLRMAFGILSTRLGPHWALSDAEAKNGAEVTNAMIEKYLPAMGAYAVEFAFLGWAAFVIGPKAFLTYQLAEAKKSEIVEQPSV